MQAPNSKNVKGDYQMSEIGKFLKELRGQRSLREIEKVSGVSHTYLSSLEKGADPRTGKERKPTTETLEKLAKAYNHSYFDLLERAGYLADISEDEKERLLVNDEYQSSIEKMLDDALKAITKGEDFIDEVKDEVENVQKKYDNYFEEDEILTPEMLKKIVLYADWNQEWIWNLATDILLISRNYISNGKTVTELTTFLNLPGITYKNNSLSKEDRNRIVVMLNALFPE